MFKFVLLLSFVVCSLGAALPEEDLPQLNGRIVGGTATTINNFPWQISLQRNGNHICGGSVYSSNVIITAARCLQSVTPSCLKVRAGSTYWNSGGILLDVAAFKIHEGYNANTKANDIAVVRLSSSLSFSSNIKAIELSAFTPGNGVFASVSGWGTEYYGSSAIPSQLQYAEVNILSRSVCDSSRYGYGNQIESTMICAASDGKDSCQGDFGGPLFSEGALVGVVSWGFDCGNRYYPGVYADVAVHRNWLISAASNV